MTAEKRRKAIHKKWLIRPIAARGRWTWEIPYPVSGFAITGIKSFKTQAWAIRDAFRVIKLLKRSRSAAVKHNG